MSFTPGDIHVICPACGMPVTVAVVVRGVEPEQRDQRLRVEFQPSLTAIHACRTFPT